MPLTRASQDSKEADTVRSAPGREGLYVPTVQHIEAHLLRLRAIIRSANTTDSFKQRAREDADALLDRLLLLSSVRWSDNPDEAQTGAPTA